MTMEDLNSSSTGDPDLSFDSVQTIISESDSALISRQETPLTSLIFSVLVAASNKIFVNSCRGTQNRSPLGLKIVIALGSKSTTSLGSEGMETSWVGPSTPTPRSFNGSCSNDGNSLVKRCPLSPIRKGYPFRGSYTSMRSADSRTVTWYPCRLAKTRADANPAGPDPTTIAVLKPETTTMAAESKQQRKRIESIIIPMYGKLEKA
mmetsp:Transcript_30295/g.72631  ORF Transcript_30295/g.72631 Transcript_30295/m.72631 type:complete len:206 (-) Transcript_30295:6-623(-)